MMNKLLNMKKIVLVLALLLASTCVSAGDMKFEVTVDRNQLTLEDAARLTVSLSGEKAVKLDLELPRIDGFEARYLGPSTQVTIINGAYSKTTSYIYNLFPLREGAFEIPSLTIRIDGQLMSSDPIKINVRGSSGGPAPAQGANAQGQKGLRLDEKIFMKISTPKDTVFLDEQIPLQIKFYVNELSVSDIQMPELEGVGFSVDEFDEPRQYSQVVNGVRYDVVEFNANIYPTRFGRLVLGPVKMQANLLYRPTRRRRSGFFDDDFFNDFFGRVERRAISVESNSMMIQVKDLPSCRYDGGFSGAVGQFTFDVSVSPVEVGVGDPITVRVQVIGSGGLKSIEVPSYHESNDFKVYEPQVSQENNRKVSEQVLIPRSEDVRVVPEIVFSVFDPDIEKYRLIKRGPFPIKVNPSEDKGSFKVVALRGGDVTVIEEAIGKDLIFLKDKPGRLVKGVNRFSAGLLNKFLYGLFSFILFVGIFLLKWINRMRTDSAFVKRLKAVKKAHKQLEPIVKNMGQVAAKDVYDTLYRVLSGYFLDKLSIDAANIEFMELKSILSARGINSNVLTRIESIIDQCNKVRFASFEPNPTKMKDHIRECESIIAECEKVLK